MWSNSKNILQSFSALPSNASEFGRESFSSGTALILMGMGMEKYIDLFKDNNISTEIFIELSDDDLISLGISDAADRQQILSYAKNKKPYTSDVGFYAPENAAEDTIMIKRLLNQSHLIDKHLKELLDRVDITELDDYFVTNVTKASSALKVVAEKTLKQSENICRSIYDGKSESLISAISKKTGINLPGHLRSKLTTLGKLPKKRALLMLLTALGMCSIATLLCIS